MADQVQEFTSLVFFLMFPLLLVLIGVYLFAVWRFERYMQFNHPEEWKLLGSPNVITHNTFSNNLKFMRYISRRAYSQLNDSILSKYASICWYLYVAIAVIFLGLSCILVIAYVGPVLY